MLFIVFVLELCPTELFSDQDVLFCFDHDVKV